MSDRGDDLGGVGADPIDAPRLPDPTPDPMVPYLPEAPRPVAEPAPEPEFDAKAMVEAQRIKPNAKPAYGDIPSPTSDTKEAVEKLRQEATKKKRRNKRFARMTLAAFCAVVAVAGYLAYDAFRDEHAANDAATEEIEAGASGGSGAPGDEPGALTPIGEQAEVIAGMDTLDDVATGSAGALLGAVDDARAAVDDLNGVQPDAAPAAPDAAAPAALPGTIDAAILRYDLGSVSDPVVHHVVAHLASDTYLIATVAGGTLRDVAETGTADVARYDAEGGIATRTARSAASLEGGPDALFVSAVSPGVLLPPAAEPFARPTSIGVTDTSGRPLAAEAYVVDVEAFRAADPETAAAWLTVLALADPMSTLEEGLPNLDANLLAVRREVDAMVARVDAGAVAGSPPIATSGQVVVGWTAAAGEPYVRSAYAASGDRTFQWLYRVTAVDQPAVTVFAVR